jgi:hypothetical protein
LIDGNPELMGKATKEGKTLLHLAVETRSSSICELLLEKAAEFNTFLGDYRFVDALDEEEGYAAVGESDAIAKCRDCRANTLS